MRATSCKNISDRARRWAGRNTSDRKRSDRFVPRGRRTVAHGPAGRQQGGWASGISRTHIAKWTIGQARVDSSTTSSATGHPRTIMATVRGQGNAIPYTSTCTADANITSWTATRKKVPRSIDITDAWPAEDDSLDTTCQCSHFIPYTAITVSHALLLLHHMH